MNKAYCLNPIGVIHSCFKEKFTIPRQSGLVKQASATLELIAPYNRIEAVRGLDKFSHLWVIFIFHMNAQDKSNESDQNEFKGQWKPTVRPPRLGGNERVGVFASRSPHRPNPIGMSAVKLEKVEQTRDKIELHISGVDLLDGTPVLDIKPYVGYADSIEDSYDSFADANPEITHKVVFSDQADAYCQNRIKEQPDLREMIINILETDPRPAYYKKYDTGLAEREFGVYMLDFELRWIVQEDQILVTALNGNGSK